MQLARNRCGYTMAEVLTVAGIIGMISVGIASMMIGAMKCYDSSTTKAYTDADAVIAMQMIVNDVREAKSINIIGGGTRLRIVFPERTADGYYNRYVADTAHQIDYYLSDSTGTPGHSGTWLWRGKDNDRTPVKRDVNGLMFEQDTSRSVKITIVAENKTASGTQRTELTQRVVYLRNY